MKDIVVAHIIVRRLEQMRIKNIKAHETECEKIVAEILRVEDKKGLCGKSFIIGLVLGVSLSFLSQGFSSSGENNLQKNNKQVKLAGDIPCDDKRQCTVIYV